MNYYFEISDKDAVIAIDNALLPINSFDKKLRELKEKYKSDKEMIFNSYDRGLSFSCLAFSDYPWHLDTRNEFKVSAVRHVTCYQWEARPRKANKKFYKEFMEDLDDCLYVNFKQVLYGPIGYNSRRSIEYTKIDNFYYISSSLPIILPHRELTATQYSLCVN